MSLRQAIELTEGAPDGSFNPGKVCQLETREPTERPRLRTLKLLEANHFHVKRLEEGGCATHPHPARLPAAAITRLAQCGRHPEH